MNIKWVIRKNNIEDAIKLIDQVKPRKRSLAKQIALSLEIYKSRGEFDGTLESAIECLKQAEYEIELIRIEESEI